MALQYIYLVYIIYTWYKFCFCPCCCLLFADRSSSETEVEGSDGRPTLNDIHDNTITADSEVMVIREADGNTIEASNPTTIHIFFFINICIANINSAVMTF